MSTILVIEDEPQVRANICEILALADHTPLVAQDGAVGIRVALAQLPDLIICDVMMPILDGYGVISELRRHAQTAHIPFIFLTAQTGHEAQRQGMQLGADDYLIKPFTPEELLDAIAVRLHRHRSLIEKYTHQLEEAKEAVEFLKHYDLDTGLPNYQLFEKHFELAKGYAQQQRLVLAVLVVEIDQLEYISATLGHRIRKLLLEAFAQRLTNLSRYHPLTASLSVQETVIEAVSYLGGRQFGLLSSPLEGSTAGLTVAALAQALLHQLQQPFVVAGEEIFVKPGVGIALCPDNGAALDLLLGCAEGAISKGYNLSADGSYQFYTTQQHVQALARFQLVSKLHHALENNELEVFYQPQFELTSQRLVGAEALIRWRLPDQGYISPAEFIPIAEETGLIMPIGEWVLETACRQLRQWQQETQTNLKISVNLSAKQFYHPDLAGQVEDVLRRTGLAPQRLVLEITESSILEDTQKALQTLETLKALGLSVAIDDFGTGYSSLSCLRQFPFDLLKIDQSFVRNIHKTPNNVPITRIIIQLAQELNLDLVAEGIETQQELDFLVAHCCHMGQGYLFGRPTAAPEFSQAFLAGSTVV